jgi:hypothetical protein
MTAVAVALAAQLVAKVRACVEIESAFGQKSSWLSGCVVVAALRTVLLLL